MGTEVMHDDSDQIKAFAEHMRHVWVAADRLAKGMRRVAVAADNVCKMLREQREDIYRAAWWKRGEEEPEFLARYEPEWWQRGEEPPPFGCAA